MHLSSSYAAVFDEVLSTAAIRPESSLIAFWPVLGSRYRGDLMVVGQALNGGMPPAWRPYDCADMDYRNEVVKNTREAWGEENQCPMEWVVDPNRGYGAKGRKRPAATASAFWRVTRSVVHGLVPAATGSDTTWPSFVCWTNLYKVSPAAGGNPTPGFRTAQMSLAVRLFQLELAELQPRRVLVMTGRTWFEGFAQRMGLSVQWRSGFVVGTAGQDVTTWVVSRHPRYKMSGETETSMAREILTAYGELREV
jgi:hypothetical protein